MQRVLVLGGVIYIFLILALADTNGTLLALMLPFMVYLGIGFTFSPGKLDFSVDREISQKRVYPGEEIHVRLTVTNHGPRVELVQIEDQIPEGLRITQGETRQLIPLNPGESTELGYSLRGPRGFYHFRAVEIIASDTLQIRNKIISAATDEYLFIQPEQIRVGRLEIRPRRTRVYAGYIPARAGGPGVEFFGVREYQPGDPLRWVNWRASTRQYQRFFINEFEQERVADVGVILDTRLRSEIKARSGVSLFDFSVQAAAALAETFLNDGNRVGLLLYGTILDWTLPDYGKVQRERILQRLASAKPGESLVFGELENLPTRLLPPKSQIVFISPLHESDIPVLVGLRARGYSVMVISPNPVTFQLKFSTAENHDSRLAVRLAGLERLLIINKLKQAGIQVLDWHIETPLDQALPVVLSQPFPVLAMTG